MGLIPTGEIMTHPWFAAMGPEPLGPDFTPALLEAAFAGRKQNAKVLLLDQRIVAGLGNIYVCEALFRSHLSPRRLAATLATKKGEPTDHARRLVGAIHEVLNQAIKAGGSSLRDHRQTDGELGYFQHSFQVYDREGEPCQTDGCSGIVKRFVQNGVRGDVVGWGERLCETHLAARLVMGFATLYPSCDKHFDHHAGDRTHPMTDASSPSIRFNNGASYERMMGVWSRSAGEIFLDWVAPPPGLSWVDVGCGNGAFTQLIAERHSPSAIN
eukprot:gene15259-20218_t